jgi:peptidoglycan-N-acetylglucosamine deacetylase
MARGAIVHLVVIALAISAWELAPRDLAPIAVVATLLLSAGVIGLLVTSARSQLFVDTVFRGNPAGRALAFTFDDGPDPTYTNDILDVLREAKVKATFFVVGAAAEGHPDLLRRIVSDGHLVASHTFSHAHTFHFWGSRAMAADITKGIDAVERITGERPAYFRPPQGLRVPTLRDARSKIAVPPVCVTWTARGMDTVTRSPEKIVERLEKALVPGAILTLHDGTAFGGLRTRAATVLALKSLLATARARNLACVRLDELLEKRL